MKLDRGHKMDQFFVKQPLKSFNILKPHKKLKPPKNKTAQKPFLVKTQRTNSDSSH